MKRVVSGLGLALTCALVFATGCKKESPPAPPAPPAPVAIEALTGTTDEQVVDEILAAAPTAAPVPADQVKRYVVYRQKVLERLRALVADRHAADAGTGKLDVRVAAAVRAKEATQSFAEQMRAAEEAVREDLGLSREAIVAAGRVAAEVLAQRQIWRMSGGDAALEKAREELKKLEGSERVAAEKRLAANETEFAVVREAKRARERYGDPAVDAVLEHEEALWTVQQQTSRLTAEIY